MTDSLWEMLVATALIGTERRPLTLENVYIDAQLTPVITAAADILDIVAATALYRRAGAPPLHVTLTRPEPCDLDDLPPVNPEAAELLPRVLYGDKKREYLIEWLTLTIQTEQRIPDEWLPTLLSTGRNDKSIRPLIAVTLGKRGRWLAAQNTFWSYALEPQHDIPQEHANLDEVVKKLLDSLQNIDAFVDGEFGGTVLSALKRGAHQIPITAVDTLLRAIQERLQSSSGGVIIPARLLNILNFRRTMYHAFGF